MMESIGVVIVNWNSGRHLKKCLVHVTSQTLMPQKILVVDNKSTDGSCDCIKDFPEVELVPMATNLGFAAANNIAVKNYLDTRWAVLLNPDAFPEPGWLAALYEASINYPDYDVFGSRMLSHENQSCLDGTGDCYHISGMAWRRGHGSPAAGRYEKSDDIFSPCAAAAMYKREAFLALGGFDEDMFCYFEDVDLGFRFNLAGYKCRYVARAVVSHVGSGSVGKYSDFAIYHGHRNLVWCYVANMPSVLFWIFLPLHILLNIVSIYYMTWQGHGLVIVKAKFNALLNIKKSLKKRRKRAFYKSDTGRLLKLMSFNPVQRM